MPIHAKTRTSTIAAGGNLGTAVDLDDAISVGVIIDALWDSGDQLGFKVCDTEGGTYVALYDTEASLVTMAVTASCAYALETCVFAPWRFIKAWSQNGSGENAAQTGGAVVTFVMK